jgi:hypothetical protein
MSTDHEPRLGIDIGNVIMAGDNDALFGRSGGYSEQRMLGIPEMPGAVDAIGRLIRLFGPEQVYLISKAHKNTEAKTLRWLAHHDFCARTGLDERHIWFCREWPEKAVICGWLGIAFFVDDRADVLSAMISAPHRYLFGPQSRVAPDGLVAVPDWATAEAAIREDHLFMEESSSFEETRRD